MNGLLIYYLYHFLLNSEGLAEIIFVYVFVCSVYFLQVLEFSGMLRCLNVGKAHCLLLTMYHEASEGDLPLYG